MRLNTSFFQTADWMRNKGETLPLPWRSIRFQKLSHFQQNQFIVVSLVRLAAA